MINILYLYPQCEIISNEINLCRIIDEYIQRNYNNIWGN